MIFDFKKEEKLLKAGIKECIFKMDLQRIYLVTNQYQNYKKYVVKIEINKETQKNKSKVLKVKIDGHSFRVDNTNENLIYFIKEKTIYKMDFEKSLGKIETFINKGLNMLTNKEEEMDKIYGAEEFFQSEHNINFLRFEQSMRFFYCNEGRTIKRICSESKDIINSYDDVEALYTDIKLSKDEKLIYR